MARITGLAFDSLGGLFASTLGAVPFPPPPPLSASSLDLLNAATGALLSSVPITDAGAPIAIADLAIQPGSNVLYGVSTAVGGTAPGQLYTINKTTGAATKVGTPLAFFTSIAFAPNGTLYESAADLNEATGGHLSPRLQVLNPVTGAIVGTPVQTSAFFGALGIRPTDSAIFGGTGDEGDIFIVNPATGAQTLVGNTGLNFVGDLAFTPVPEPGTLLLTGLGLLSIAVLRRKHKRPNLGRRVKDVRGGRGSA